MAIPPIASSAWPNVAQPRSLGNTRLVDSLVLLALLALCLVFTWTTRDAMANLSFLNQKDNPDSAGGKKTIVDVSPWQTAQALAPLAVTAEEKEYASDAERLADHEVDQAFASALRQATLEAQHLHPDRRCAGAFAKEWRNFSNSSRRTRMQVQSDHRAIEVASAQERQACRVRQGDLEVAKAQLGLDTDELADAQQDLDRASGDQTLANSGGADRARSVDAEYDKQVQRRPDRGHICSAARNHGRASRAWFSQRTATS